MTPEERIQAYNDAVQVLNDYTAQETAKVGNSQRSLGGLAAQVASPTGQTSGLANYTYNRTIRPTIDTLSANLTTTGLSQGMEKQLYDALQAAKSAYEDAKNKYTVAASTPKSNATKDPYTEVTDTEYTGEQVPYPEAGQTIGVGTTGNGVYDIVITDGEGGYYRKQVSAGSEDEARRKTTIVGVGTTGNGVYDIILGDGSRKQFIAGSEDEAKRKYYRS